MAACRPSSRSSAPIGWLFARQPNAEERKRGLRFSGPAVGASSTRGWRRNDKAPLPRKCPQGHRPARAAAFVDFCHALLNSNEFLYMN